MNVFVDTSAWYAAADSADSSHRQARAILSTHQSFVTTDHVLVETWMLLRHRIGRKPALLFWERLAGAALIETVTVGDLDSGRRIADAWKDQDFSIVDCTSFAVMLRLGIRSAASYDSDFAVFRFGPGRRLAFEVLR